MRRIVARGIKRSVVALGVVATLGAAPVWAQDAPESGQPLRLDDVLTSLEETYPPLLAALIERDLREGRLQGARSAFDLDLFGKVGGTPSGYYEYNTVEAGVQQFLGLWGSSVYGGYRLTTGEELPDYYAQRTQGDGEGTVGLRLPLLRGGATDKDRTRIAQAEIDTLIANPVIARQRLDFVRAGTVAYFKWLASGRTLQLARQLLEVALLRTAALEEQVANGLRAEIVLVDNQRLVVDRELEVIEAELEFQAAALSLSLFLRTPDGEPVAPGEDVLPQAFPELGGAQEAPEIDRGLRFAIERRPELLQLGLELESAELDRRLARNDLLPYLDANVELARNAGDNLYADRSDTELRAELAFKLPLQRREAEGKLQEVDAKISQTRQKLTFATDKILAEVRKAWAALGAAQGRTDRAARNVELAEQLRAAEAEQFRVGASDLLALQIREQSAFDAQLKQVSAFLDYFTALADYEAAIATGVIPPERNP